jgi:pyrroloquinoline-quinone synthase
MTTVDGVIEAQHLLKHPFYQRWQRGHVSLPVLQAYAVQYYAYESALPSFLEQAMAHLPEGPARASLAANLADEAGGPNPHPELWLRFAEGLGLCREEVIGGELLAGTEGLVATYRSLCQQGADQALGALYAYESQFPAVAATKAEGLRRFYGMTSARELEFFDLHSTLDVEHAAGIAAGMTESPESVRAAVEAIDAWWGMLDAFEAMSAEGR